MGARRFVCAIRTFGYTVARMTQIRIETDGLTPKEAMELAQIIQGFEGVEAAQFSPIKPGSMQYRSFPMAPQAALAVWHVVVHLAEIGTAGAALGVGKAAAEHAYKKVGEAIVDKAWDAIKAKFTGKSVVDVGVKLYGPYGELIKEITGKR
ncbi:hypothetical protein [Terriglobus roseus]|uniref:Uncharacterized protein n=1 Tax=Terriglobus roseus TaxID=392734 RepID=A0A1G7QTC9_9BACT|nr:hypothetical protein [Terriglobus roseus]SDG00920.1 hypothetical protein SAMN05444167_3964 [Terriglobus roseus]